MSHVTEQSNEPVQSLKKTYKFFVDVFIVNLKQLLTLVLVFVVSLWNLLLYIKTLNKYFTTTEIEVS